MFLLCSNNAYVIVACMYVESNRLQRNGNTYRTVANITDLPQHAIDAVQQALRLGHVVARPGQGQEPAHHLPDEQQQQILDLLKGKL